MRSIFLMAYISCAAVFPIIGATAQYSPETVIFAFDFHDVVVNFNSKKFLSKLSSLFANSEHKIEILKNAYWMVKDARKIKKKYDVLDDLLAELTKKYPFLAAYIDKIQDAVNCHKPNMDTIKIIKELKQRGYKIYLASNISPKSYEIIKKKEPKVLELFDEVYTAHQKKLGSDDLYTHAVKPQLGYFHGLRAFMQDVAPQDAGKKIIFVDDKVGNIKAGITADKNLVGIHFTKPADFKNKLVNLGILH